MHYKIRGKEGIWRKMAETRGKYVLKKSGSECVCVCEAKDLTPILLELIHKDRE